MTEAVSPQGTQGWVEFLANKQLPVRNSVQQRLKRELQRNNANLKELGGLIKSDPVLCLYIVKAAGQLHAAKGSEVTSIDHAINSLGLDHIEDVAFRVPALKLNPASTAQKMYFRAIANSHHAAVQARSWAQSRNSLFTEETFLAALFYGIGHWLLWHYAPLHMSEIQRKQREDGIDVVLAENDVLGSTIQEISLGLVDTWALSKLASTSLDHDTSPARKTLTQLHQRAMSDPRLGDEELRELNHLVQEKFFPVKLANWLALTVQLGWQSTKAMKIVDIINDYLKGTLSQTLALLHQNCAQASRGYHVPGSLAPAAEMLFIRSSLQVNFRLSPREMQNLPRDCPRPATKRVPSDTAPNPTAEPPAASRAATEKPSFLNPHIYTQVAERLVKGSDLYTEPKHLLQGALQALHAGLGLERVVMHLVQSKNHRLRAALAQGLEPQHPFMGFSHNLEVPSLFKRLCEKPGCIWITAENRHKMLRLLPDSYHAFVPEQGSLLMSVFMDKRPVAIIHADRGSSQKTLGDFHHERFRYICSATSLAMKRMAQGK